MMNSMPRARWVAVGIAIAALAGCSDWKDQLLAPQNPGVIDPGATGSPAAAAALKVGALGRLRFMADCSSGECLWEEAGSLTDEFHNADFQNTRQDIDQRQITDDNPTIGGGNGPYLGVSQQRGFVRDALTAVKQYLPQNSADIGELYMALGFLETSLAENFCNGIPLGHTVSGVVTYGPALTDAQVLDSASAHLDSALAAVTGTDVNSVFVHNAALVVKARILTDQGKFTQAAALLASVPTSFQYLFATDPSSTSDDNGIWNIQVSQQRLSVSDSFEIVNGVTSVTKNALPFASANDPRVGVKAGLALSPAVGPEDGSTPMFVATMFGRDDPLPMVSGIDARLIEAEAKLNAGDIGGMMTILNALRQSPQKIGVFSVPAMGAITTVPVTQDDATTLFFREKAFWTFGRGQRLNDERRLMRQYKRTEDQVFPTGAYFKGGTYGHSIQLPVPTSELANPQYNGCIDHNP
jgi:hypothetical protein